jgi:hypothetical protein
VVAFAFLSFLVAVVSAVYARVAATAAHRQNEIAIHNERLKIFKAFLDYYGKLRTCGANVPEQDLWKDFWPHARLAKFYYSESVSAELDKFIELLREMMDFRELNDSSYNEQINAKFYECRDAAGQIEKEMEKELCLIKNSFMTRGKIGAFLRRLRGRRDTT